MGKKGTNRAPFPPPPPETPSRLEALQEALRAARCPGAPTGRPVHFSSGRTKGRDGGGEEGSGPVRPPGF